MYSPTDNPPFGGYSPDLSVLKQGIDFVLGSSVVVAVMFFYKNNPLQLSAGQDAATCVRTRERQL